MKEEFLHFLWRTHKIPKIGLETTCGDPIEILSPGILNHNDGPDFFEAKIRIGDVVWVGPLEIHLKSSDWLSHKHHHDPRYQSVILHVVLEDNQSVHVLNRRLPSLEIKKFINPELVEKYINLQSCKENLACSTYQIDEIQESFLWMRDRLLTERLQRRLREVSTLSTSASAIFYKMLLAALGAKDNRSAFMDFANLINWTLLSRWQNRPDRIYAYFMFLSGLFEQEMNHFSDKTLLSAHIPQPMKKELWQTRSIRPANQPKRRILEFCLMFTQGVFTPLLESEDAFTYNNSWNTVLQNLISSEIGNHKYSNFIIRNIALNAVVPYAFVQTSVAVWTLKRFIFN